MTANDRFHKYLLTAPKAFSSNSQEGQTPELTDVTFGRSNAAEWGGLVTVIVVPTPNLTTELRGIGLDEIPVAVVRPQNLVMQFIIVAKVYPC